MHGVTALPASGELLTINIWALLSRDNSHCFPVVPVQRLPPVSCSLWNKTAPCFLLSGSSTFGGRCAFCPKAQLHGSSVTRYSANTLHTPYDPLVPVADRKGSGLQKPNKKHADSPEAMCSTHLPPHLLVWSLTMSVLNEGLLHFLMLVSRLMKGGDRLLRPNVTTGESAMASPRHDTSFFLSTPTLMKPKRFFPLSHHSDKWGLKEFKLDSDAAICVFFSD